MVVVCIFFVYRWSALPLEMLKGHYDLHKWSGESCFEVWKRVSMQKRQTDCIDDNMDSIPDCAIDRKKISASSECIWLLWLLLSGQKMKDKETLEIGICPETEQNVCLLERVISIKCMGENSKHFVLTGNGIMVPQGLWIIND
jgi:hypothetical protein